MLEIEAFIQVVVKMLLHARRKKRLSIDSDVTYAMIELLIILAWSQILTEGHLNTLTSVKSNRWQVLVAKKIEFESIEE